MLEKAHVKKDIIGLEASRAIIASVCYSTGRPIGVKRTKYDFSASFLGTNYASWRILRYLP